MSLVLIQNTHARTSIAPAAFEHAIPAGERPLAYAVERAAVAV